MRYPDNCKLIYEAQEVYNPTTQQIDKLEDFEETLCMFSKKSLASTVHFTLPFRLTKLVTWIERNGQRYKYDDHKDKGRQSTVTCSQDTGVY